MISLPSRHQDLAGRWTRRHAQVLQWAGRADARAGRKPILRPPVHLPGTPGRTVKNRRENRAPECAGGKAEPNAVRHPLQKAAPTGGTGHCSTR